MEGGYIGATNAKGRYSAIWMLGWLYLTVGTGHIGAIKVLPKGFLSIRNVLTEVGHALRYIIFLQESKTIQHPTEELNVLLLTIALYQTKTLYFPPCGLVKMTETSVDVDMRSEG